MFVSRVRYWYVHCLTFSKINFTLARLTSYETLYFSSLDVNCAKRKNPHHALKYSVYKVANFPSELTQF